MDYRNPQTNGENTYMKLEEIIAANRNLEIDGIEATSTVLLEKVALTLLMLNSKPIINSSGDWNYIVDTLKKLEDIEHGSELPDPIPDSPDWGPDPDNPYPDEPDTDDQELNMHLNASKLGILSSDKEQVMRGLRHLEKAWINLESTSEFNMPKNLFEGLTENIGFKKEIAFGSKKSLQNRNIDITNVRNYQSFLLSSISNLSREIIRKRRFE